MRRTLIIAASLLALAGCGSAGGREEAASRIATLMLSAVADRDGELACAALAPQTAAELTESAGRPCAQAILDDDLPEPGALTATSVYGQWAQVRFTTDTVFLAVFDDGWRVVAAGCEARGERPYDCSLQGS